MSRTKNPIIVGLDIGTTKIVAIAGRKNEYGKLEILGYGKAESAGVNHGIVLNIDQCLGAINEALNNCKTNFPQLKIKDVYVGIAGQHIKSRQTRGDYVRSNTDDTINKDDLEALISMQKKSLIPEGDEVIDVIPQDFIVDNTHVTLNPIGMSGVKIGANFHVVTGSKNDIKNIKKCVDKAQLNTLDLVLQPIASAAAIVTPEDLEAGVAIVDIGGGTTDMAVFHDGILHHTTVIPFAGTNLTEDIRNGLGVLRSQAEQMKVQFGSAIPDNNQNNKYITIPGLKGMEPKHISQKNLANIINARMVEIFEYVLYHLKQINLYDKLHGGIILTGGGSQLQHVIQLCQFTTGLHTRIGYPNEHLTGELTQELSHPMYATCIGLILRGISDYESGKLKHASNHDLGDDMPEPFIEKTTKPTVQHDAVRQPVANKNFINSKEDIQNNETEKGSKKSEAVSSVLKNLKNKFMSLFEDEKDSQEL